MIRILYNDVIDETHIGRFRELLISRAISHDNAGNERTSYISISECLEGSII